MGTKLLVPTPPQYDQNQQIIAGKDPNVGTFQGIAQSFNDAPGGTQEEWNEVNHQIAHEFRFVLKDFFMVAVREGLFFEHQSKGNRKYASVGMGIGVAGFRLDAGGLIPFQQRHPLSNTLYIGLSYRMKLGKNQKLMRFPRWSPEQEYEDEVEAILDEAD